VSSAPTQVRHYYRAARSPFLNLSDLNPPALKEVVDVLNTERRSGDHQRVFGRKYLDLRRRTEQKLRAKFVEIGGQPEREAPHYFVLGESRWFEGLALDMESVVLDVADFPDETTSFTYPDSFTSMALAPEYGLPYEPKPYHDQVFCLTQLRAVIDQFGLPADPTNDYDGYENRPFEHYVEVQLWSDFPIQHLLQPSRTSKARSD
jgi:hypothetical protein